MWILFAFGSAIFAALTSILAKVGIEGVGSNLATAIRTMVVVIMAWGMVFITHQQSGIGSISQKAGLFLSCPDLLREHRGFVTIKLCRWEMFQKSFRSINCLLS